MKLIEPGEMEDFYKVLARFNLSAEDFDLVETDTTDPQSDEIFGLTDRIRHDHAKIHRQAK